MDLKGSVTALITPFRNGEVDEQGYRELIEWQIAEGSNGIVPVGTTGESPTLSAEEHKRVIEIAERGVKVALHAIQVTAGKVQAWGVRQLFQPAFQCANRIGNIPPQFAIDNRQQIIRSSRSWGEA